MDLGAAALTIVTTRRWMAEEMAATTILPVRHNLGFDLPARTDDTAWWMPAEHAARVLASGVEATLTAPGPTWLSDIPASMRGRVVDSFQLADWPEHLSDQTGWCKPAEAKIETLPAHWRTGAQFLAEATAVGLPPQSWVQWCPTRLDLACEFRCYILDGACRTVSLYLTTAVDGSQLTYYDGASADAATTADAARFAAETARDLGDAQPPAYCLDVAFDRVSGRWLVVEANPAWCSAWYGCDIDAVAETIVRACRPRPGDAIWAWRPDSYLTGRASRMRPLPLRQA